MPPGVDVAFGAAERIGTLAVIAILLAFGGVFVLYFGSKASARKADAEAQRIEYESRQSSAQTDLTGQAIGETFELIKSFNAERTLIWQGITQKLDRNDANDRMILSKLGELMALLTTMADVTRQTLILVKEALDAKESK